LAIASAAVIVGTAIGVAVVVTSIRVGVVISTGTTRITMAIMVTLAIGASAGNGIPFIVVAAH
jgi:hypothetical protein